MEFGGTQTPGNGFAYSWASATCGSIKSVDVVVSAADMFGLTQKTVWVPDQQVVVVGVGTLPSVDFDSGGSVSWNFADPATKGLINTNFMEMPATNLKGDPATFTSELNYYWRCPFALFNPTNPLVLYSEPDPSDFVSGSLAFRVFYL